MNREAVAERVTSILRWCWYFVYLQFLFVAGTLAGAVVGGVFPSLYASTLAAKELMGPDGGYFATRRYLRLYRAGFWRSQRLGYLSVLVLLVCVSNVVFFNQLQDTAPWAYFVKMLWLAAGVVVMAALSLVSTSFVDYRLPLRSLPRLLVAGLRDIRSILLIVLAGAALAVAVLAVTGLFLYVAAGAFLVVLAAANTSFERRMIAFDDGGRTGGGVSAVPASGGWQ